MSFVWSFGEVTGGVSHGFRDSGMHLFGSNAFESMVREGIQNSIDAQDPEKDLPVHVAFTLDVFNPQEHDELSGLAEFLVAGRKIEETRDKYSDETAWYKNAISSIVHGEGIEVLGLHDANTLGLSGKDRDSSDAASPWIALVRGQGINAKRSTESLGGFGHGSNAAFGMSDLRTVFYLSSSTDEVGLPVTRFQGHSILQSLYFGTKKTNRDGFYGTLAEGEINPIQGAEIPTWFRDIRHSAVGAGMGTSTFIFSPREAGIKDLWPALTLCILANYSYAISKGKLRVSLGNGKEITAENIRDIFLDLSASQTVDDLGLSAGVGASLESTATILSPSLTGTEPVTGFGQYEWFLRLDENIAKPAVGVARDPGMLLTRDALHLQGFPGYAGFDLFVCVRSGSLDKVTGRRKGGAVIIKSMEDPSHTKLSLDWVAEVKRAEVKSAYSKFTNHVRNLIREKASPKFAAEITIEIDDLFGSDPLGQEEKSEGMTTVTVLPGKKKRAHFHQLVTNEGSDEKISLPSGKGAGGQGGEGGTPPEGPPGGIPGLTNSLEKSPLRKLRVIQTDEQPSQDWVQVKVILEADKGGTRGLTLFLAGETQSEQIPLRLDLASSATWAPILVAGESTGRAEVKVWAPREALNFALNGEIHYGV